MAHPKPPKPLEPYACDMLWRALTDRLPQEREPHSIGQIMSDLRHRFSGAEPMPVAELCKHLGGISRQRVYQAEKGDYPGERLKSGNLEALARLCQARGMFRSAQFILDKAVLSRRSGNRSLDDGAPMRGRSTRS